MVIAFFPAIAFPAAHTVFATIRQLDPVSPIQPLPMRLDRSISRAIAGSLTTEVLRHATTITATAISIIVYNRLLRWLFCRARSSTRIVVAYFLTFTAVADIANVPVIDFQCPAAVCSIAVVG